MSILSLIIKREFIAKVRNKSFIVMTFLSPLIFVGIAVLIGFLSNMKADMRTIAVHDATGRFFHDFKSDKEYRFTDLSQVPLQVLKDSIVKESYDGLLVIPNEGNNEKLQSGIQFYSNDDPSLEFISGLEKKLSEKLTAENYVKAGIDPLNITKQNANVSIAIKKANGQDSVKGVNWIKAIMGGIFGYLIMMFIIIYGNMVMRSVIEEKTSRIIEIIISSVKPFQLMMGKIIGTSLAGVLQFAIWSVCGVILMFVASSVFGVDVTSQTSSQMMTTTAPPNHIVEVMKEIFNLPIIATLLVSFIVYFIGGYFLYSSFYAAIGAAVDSETDSQQFLFPIIMPLVLGVYIGFFTVINDPHGTVATIFSFIPLTSPIVMLMRIPFGVPWWQLVLSALILYGTFYAVVWFAAKIYRVGILMYGKKPTWGEIFRWIRISN